MQGGTEIAHLEWAIRMEHARTVHVGDRVSFHMADVYLPEASEVLAKLTPEVEMNGVVVEFSDSGNYPSAYALVRITEHQSVLLPVTALRVVS